jgi:hypothetical protein
MIYEILKSMTVAHFITIGVDILLLLVCLTALVVAIIRWKRHPAVSAVTILSSLLTVGGAISLFCIWFYLFEVKTKRIFDSDNADKFMDLALSFQQSSIVILLLASILQIILVPLFLGGILMGRGKSESNSP